MRKSLMGWRGRGRGREDEGRGGGAGERVLGFARLPKSVVCSACPFLDASGARRVCS